MKKNQSSNKGKKKAKPMTMDEALKISKKMEKEGMTVQHLKKGLDRELNKPMKKNTSRKKPTSKKKLISQKNLRIMKQGLEEILNPDLSQISTGFYIYSYAPHPFKAFYKNTNGLNEWVSLDNKPTCFKTQAKAEEVLVKLQKNDPTVKIVYYTETPNTSQTEEMMSELLKQSDERAFQWRTESFKYKALFDKVFKQYTTKGFPTAKEWNEIVETCSKINQQLVQEEKDRSLPKNNYPSDNTANAGEGEL